jgi:predicted transposase YbfD/YdcC
LPADPAVGFAALCGVLARLGRYLPTASPPPPHPGGLLAMLATVTDPRHRRGVRHPLAYVLALAIAAVACGESSITAIADWAAATARANQSLLAAVGARFNRRTRRYHAPHKDTIDRVLSALDAQQFDDVCGQWMLDQLTSQDAPTGEDPAGHDEPDQHDESDQHDEPDQPPPMRRGFAVDGKADRGTIDADGRMVNLLQAFDHTVGVSLAQRPVATKSNEIPGFVPLLTTLTSHGEGLRGWVATMDALHTQVGHANFLHAHDIDFIMIAKGNQPSLFAALDAIDWPAVPIRHWIEEQGHGRHEIRTIQLAPAPPGLPIPHVQQAFLIERSTRRTQRRNGKTTIVESAVAVLGVTSLSAARSTPQQIATHVRNHWGVENRSHWVRDVTYREDASRIRAASKPQIMATLRNTAIGLIRLGGSATIAATNRDLRYDPSRLAALLGLDLHQTQHA